MEKISPPVRILALVLVLAGLAGMLAMRTMGPSVDEAAPIPLPVRKSATPAKAVPKPAKVAAATPAVKVPRPKPLQPKAPLNPVVPPTGFPTVIDEALRSHEVVVVSLVVPGARVDELAAAEAQAGARLGGAGYLALNVVNERVARSLLKKIGAVHDPSVLVLRRSGDVVVELTGFADRETVAQAAANASS
jgi:hypothetical protein